MPFNKIKTKGRKFTRKDYRKKVMANGFPLRNKFATLQEEDTKAKPNVIDQVPCEKIFFIGKKSIFKAEKGRKIKLCTNFCDEEKFEKKTETSQYSLKCFQTFNRFEVLIENPEEDIESLIKRLNILRASRSSLKKCRKCNFKKRKCLLDPDMCEAANKVCYQCNKVGHLPKSLCCKRRNSLKKKQLKIKIKVSEESVQILSKRNRKLINQKIKTLELQQKRLKIIRVAERCAKKFYEDRSDDNKQQFLNYCCKKLQKLVKLGSIPDDEENLHFQMVLQIFDKMYDKKGESGDNLQEQAVSDEQKLQDQIENRNNLDQTNNETHNCNSKQEINIPNKNGGVSISNSMKQGSKQVKFNPNLFIPQLDGFDDEEISGSDEVDSSGEQNHEISNLD